MSAICDACNKKMNGSGCVGYFEISGKRFERIPNENDVNCHDCGAKPGALHHWGCDCETCPKCHGQSISCDCSDKYKLIIERTENIPSYKDPQFVKDYLKKLSDNDLLMRLHLPLELKQWKEIYLKELKSRGVKPTQKFVNPYSKFPTNSLKNYLKESNRDKNTIFLIQNVLEERNLPLYIVQSDTDDNDFDLQFCLEKVSRLQLLQNLGLCIGKLDNSAFPYVLAIIDEEGNVDSFTENIEGLL